MKDRTVFTAGSTAPCYEQAVRKYEIRRIKCYIEASTALTKTWTETVLALGFEHLTFNGSTANILGLTKDLKSGTVHTINRSFRPLSLSNEIKPE